MEPLTLRDAIAYILVMIAAIISAIPSHRDITNPPEKSGGNHTSTEDGNGN